MHRCFIDPSSVHGGQIELSEDEARHAAQVLRLAVGSPITALDGTGRVYSGVFTSISKRGATARIDSVQTKARPPWQVHLAQAALKSKALDQVLAKAVELDAASLTLLDAAHAVSKFDAAEITRKRPGWHNTLIEAAKQSGSAWLPVLSGPLPMEAWLKSLPEADLRLTAALTPDAAHIRGVFDHFESEKGREASSALIAIGPEGDFSRGELEALRIAGFLPVTLGRSVLRAETAATAALAVLTHELSARQSRKTGLQSPCDIGE